MLMASSSRSSATKHHHLSELRQFLERIELDEYYPFIVENLKIYSINDLRYMNESDLISIGMSKPQFRKIKRNIPLASSNLPFNHHSSFTSTLGKLLVRKLTIRSTTNLTRSSLDLNNHHDQQDPFTASLGQQNDMGKYQKQKNIISPQNIQLIEQIGEGEFGSVFKAFWKAKHNELLTVAVKRLNKSEHNLGVDDILKEVCVLQEMEHKHIVQFFGIVIQSDGSFMLVTEYAHSRSLYECLLSTNAKADYTIEILVDFLKQIASAMSYLEKKFLIHRDLAIRNILVFNTSLVKLSDFGLSRLCCSETNYYKTSWKDSLRLPIAWMSPEAINFLRFSTASDVFSFGVCMWECFTYGEMPWQGKTSAEIVNAIDAPNHQRLPRPAYATLELYQIMLQCWKYEPTERPTFSQIEKLLSEIELKKVQWKDKTAQTKEVTEGFLAMESCLLGPLTIVDRCLNVPTVNNIIQCVSADGQIGFVHNTDVEPLHIVSITKPLTNSATTTSTHSSMSNFFHRKTENKKALLKPKGRQLSKDMIGLPQADFIHAFHIGVSGETFGDVACLAGVEKSDLLKLSSEKTPSMINDLQSNYQKPSSTIEKDNEIVSSEPTQEQNGSSSLLDEVLQAFTEIYTESESVMSPAMQTQSPTKAPKKPERSTPTSPTNDAKLPSKNCSIAVEQIETISIESDSVQKLPIDDSSRFSRELEQRLQNSEISEEAKNAYNLLINGCANDSNFPATAFIDDERSNCSSRVDLSANLNEITSECKTSQGHNPAAVLFGSSSSSSTSISTSSMSNNSSSACSSSSSNQIKSDRHSHYSSTSTDNDISIDLKMNNDISPLKVLRNNFNSSKSARENGLDQTSNKSPISSASNTLSNLSSNSPLFEVQMNSVNGCSSNSLSIKTDDNQSVSSANSRSLSTTNKTDSNSITGQPLPPPPDLSSLGSKLTTATMTQTLKIPVPLTSTSSSNNTYRSKKRFNLFQ